MLEGEIVMLKAQRTADRENEKYKLELAEASASVQQVRADLEAAALAQGRFFSFVILYYDST